VRAFWRRPQESRWSPVPGLCDVEALVSAIVAFSQMAAALGDRLVEAEINPLFVLPQGRGVRAADGVAVLR